MPKIGSKLNDSIAVLEIAVTEAYNQRDTLRTLLVQARGTIDDIDKRIEGFELALELVRDASNTI